MYFSKDLQNIITEYQFVSNRELVHEYHLWYEYDESYRMLRRGGQSSANYRNNSFVGEFIYPLASSSKVIAKLPQQDVIIICNL